MLEPHLDVSFFDSLRLTGSYSLLLLKFDVSVGSKDNAGVILTGITVQFGFGIVQFCCELLPVRIIASPK